MDGRVENSDMEANEKGNLLALVHVLWIASSCAMRSECHEQHTNDCNVQCTFTCMCLGLWGWGGSAFYMGIGDSILALVFEHSPLYSILRHRLVLSNLYKNPTQSV